jgi:hypothetical protein
MPVYGVAGEQGSTAKQSGTNDTQAQTGATSGTGSASKGEAVKKSDQRDVQTRGLFSKKKKKKPVGGAAGHSQPAEQPDAPTR